MMPIVTSPTLRDVAKAAGVHTATASRALNPQTRQLVSTETARRVERAAQALGYQANPIARSLKTSRTATVGVVVPDLTNPIFPPMVRGIQESLEVAGYNALIVNTDGDPARERTQVEMLRARQVDGLIFATATREHPLLAELSEAGAHVVLVNRKVDDLPFHSVVADDASGVAQAMRHLVDFGHRRIAHLTGPVDTSTAITRLAAYRDALRAYRLPDEDALVIECSGWTEPAGAEAMSQLRDSGADYTAILAGNDLIALGCLDVLAPSGAYCPKDVSVVGFNDMALVDRIHPPLTTVTVPHHQIGLEAGRMLLECIATPERGPRAILLPVHLSVRGSTGPAPRRRRDNP